MAPFFIIKLRIVSIMKRCSSCGKEVLESYVEITCPRCGEETVLRCKSCRALNTKYSCSKCGFIGPYTVSSFLIFGEYEYET